MTREPDSTAFDAIVASWRAEGDVPEWPDDLEEACGDPRGAGPSGDPGADTPRAEEPGRNPGSAADLSGSGSAAELSGADAQTDRPASEPPAGRRGAERHPEDAASTADRSDPAGAERIRPSERPLRRAEAAEPTAEEHFVPPEPPPLPRMGPPILVGLTLITLGLVLVSFPGWVGVPQVYGLPLGLVAIAAGLGWLVLRLWPDPDDVPPPLYLDDPDDPDGGAVL